MQWPVRIPSICRSLYLFTPGAIDVDCGNLVVNRVTISNNNSNNSRAGVYLGRAGYTAQFTKGLLTTADSIFSNNTAAFIQPPRWRIM